MNPQTPANQASGTITDGSVIENALLGRNLGAPISETADRIYDKLVADEDKGGKTADEPSKPTEKIEASKKTEEAPAVATPAEPETPAEATGFFADEGLDDNEPVVTTVPEPVQPQSQQGNALEQYVAQNIGQPITVRIKLGDTIQNVQAYSLANLPEGYEYASQADHDKAILGFNILASKAEKLVNDFNMQEAQKSADQFRNQEDIDIQKDIAYLQRQKQSGKDGLDLFKTLDVNDPEFDSDPAVKEMQDVLEFYNKENNARWQLSQRNGGQYRPLTYRDAFKLYRLDNPIVGKKQQEEDVQRKEIAKPLAKASNGSGDSPKQGRPKLGRYANIDQIISAYNL